MNWLTKMSSNQVVWLIIITGISIWIFVEYVIPSVKFAYHALIGVMKEPPPPFPVEYRGVNIICNNPEKLGRIKKKIDTWITIHEDMKCPVCKDSESMLMGPSAGISYNIKCSSCRSRFWTTQYKAMGAHEL